MFDDVSGWKVGVERTPALGPHIIASRRTATEVCDLLSAHGIPHTMAGEIPNLKSPRPTVESVILVRAADSELERVQEVLAWRGESSLG
jgi:hypothetical protein